MENMKEALTLISEINLHFKHPLLTEIENILVLIDIKQGRLLLEQYFRVISKKGQQLLEVLKDHYMENHEDDTYEWHFFDETNGWETISENTFIEYYEGIEEMCRVASACANWFKLINRSKRLN